MRYLGNKESILTEISNLLHSKGLLRTGYTFFDAFCGSGSVADYFKSFYDIVINDNLTWSVIYTRGRLCAPMCIFDKLGFDPFEYLNSNNSVVHGFMYKNYAPTETQRMYFTPENAGRIDYFRKQIEEWKNKNKLTEDEYCYLVACLIESVSDVSNTAGVYGAFLKKWDSRALKDIVFNRVDFLNARCKSITTFNSKIEAIIEDVECDILYLDPPYTQNQYGTQYHLLETLVLDDNPSVSKITGSRSTSSMRSDWSKEYKANILFDRILAKTKAKYIILSYNNDGFMSKEYIEAVMKRYGKPDTYVCKKIAYKKYQNWKSQNENNHFEYLFFVEKRAPSEVVYECPLNYIGSKAKVVPYILKYQPQNYNTFIDAFGGGFNVGININTEQVIYNDINYLVSNLIRSFREYDTYDYLLYIKRIIKKFGLEKAKAEPYLAVREYYNSLPMDKRDSRLLFTIILYGFQQQIRFNGQHDFNNPIGMRWFNDKILEKTISFSRKIKEGNYVFFSDNYKNLLNQATPYTFVYFDPPYELTTGAYNDGKRGFEGWSKDLESELFSCVDQLNENEVPFMLSYVVEHKGKTNQALLDWVGRQNYHIIQLGEIIGISGSRRKEVLIINYGV
ncbi:MAG: DNA adenine methylase [Clostridiales bacterium 43-6]|nr:MAG: DNA adenine methylase [Clostridiales bacterium 43-6]